MSFGNHPFRDRPESTLSGHNPIERRPSIWNKAFHKFETGEGASGPVISQPFNFRDDINGNGVYFQGIVDEGGYRPGQLCPLNKEAAGLTNENDGKASVDGGIGNGQVSLHPTRSSLATTKHHQHPQPGVRRPSLGVRLLHAFSGSNMEEPPALTRKASISTINARDTISEVKSEEALLVPEFVSRQMVASASSMIHEAANNLEQLHAMLRARQSALDEDGQAETNMPIKPEMYASGLGPKTLDELDKLRTAVRHLHQAFASSGFLSTKKIGSDRGVNNDATLRSQSLPMISPAGTSKISGSDIPSPAKNIFDQSKTAKMWNRPASGSSHASKDAATNGSLPIGPVRSMKIAYEENERNTFSIYNVGDLNVSRKNSVSHFSNGQAALKSYSRKNSIASGHTNSSDQVNVKLMVDKMNQYKQQQQQQSQSDLRSSTVSSSMGHTISNDSTNASSYDPMSYHSSRNNSNDSTNSQSTGLTSYQSSIDAGYSKSIIDKNQAVIKEIKSDPNRVQFDHNPFTNFGENSRNERIRKVISPTASPRLHPQDQSQEQLAVPSSSKFNATSRLQRWEQDDERIRWEKENNDKSVVIAPLSFRKGSFSVQRNNDSGAEDQSGLLGRGRSASVPTLSRGQPDMARDASGDAPGQPITTTSRWQYRKMSLPGGNLTSRMATAGLSDRLVINSINEGRQPEGNTVSKVEQPQTISIQAGKRPLLPAPPLKNPPVPTHRRGSRVDNDNGPLPVVAPRGSSVPDQPRRVNRSNSISSMSTSNSVTAAAAGAAAKPPPSRNRTWVYRCSMIKDEQNEEEAGEEGEMSTNQVDKTSNASVMLADTLNNFRNSFPQTASTLHFDYESEALVTDASTNGILMTSPGKNSTPETEVNSLDNVPMILSATAEQQAIDGQALESGNAVEQDTSAHISAKEVTDTKAVSQGHSNVKSTAAQWNSWIRASASTASGPHGSALKTTQDVVMQDNECSIPPIVQPSRRRPSVMIGGQVLDVPESAQHRAFVQPERRPSDIHGTGTSMGVAHQETRNRSNWLR
ncbi:unnamed protein product [Sympodiomycopsis kandeliae]